VVVAPVETRPAAIESAPSLLPPQEEEVTEAKTVPPPLNLPGEGTNFVIPMPLKPAVVEAVAPVAVEAVQAPLVPQPPAPVPVAAPIPRPAPVQAPVVAPPTQLPSSPVVRPSASPAAQPSSAKPVFTDIKYTPRLTGPVEELRALTLKDFVRLSRDPKEATLKIKDKIDLLGDQSFEVKNQGIKAWQDSETNRLYLEILRQSLEGKPVIDVIAEREAAGNPTLSKAQFDAIMALNRTLRFG